MILDSTPHTTTTDKDRTNIAELYRECRDRDGFERKKDAGRRNCASGGQRGRGREIWGMSQDRSRRDITTQGMTQRSMAPPRRREQTSAMGYFS